MATMNEAEVTTGRKRPRRFRRSRDQRILSGFCGGLGEYFDIDPILIRLGFIALFLLTGIGPAYIAIYIIGAIFTPLGPK